MNIQVNEELNTEIARNSTVNHDKLAGAANVQLISPRDTFIKRMKRIYPEGFAGKSFLDCACNCGGYSFWAKELGAEECFGFDVREHWINQANFLLQNRPDPKENMTFKVLDLYDLPKMELEPFDITMFKGIFYHLPDPISGLKIAADLTKELLYLDTATINGYPEDCLVSCFEGTEELMSGVHGLSWFPSGPKVLEDILKWLGFVEFRLLMWNKERPKRPKNGRLTLLASRKKNFLVKQKQSK